MKLTEKERAEYIRLLRKRDVAILNAQRSDQNIKEFMLQVAEIHAVDFQPFDIEADTGEFKKLVQPAPPPASLPVPKGSKRVA